MKDNMTEPTTPQAAVLEALRMAEEAKRLMEESARSIDGFAAAKHAQEAMRLVDALAALAQQRLERRTYGSQYTPQQREWCEKYERETTFEPLMCDFEAGNETFLAAAKNSRAWFESWAGDAYLRGCDDIPGELEAMYEEITGEKHEAA